MKRLGGPGTLSTAKEGEGRWQLVTVHHAWVHLLDKRATLVLYNIRSVQSVG